MNWSTHNEAREERSDKPRNTRGGWQVARADAHGAGDAQTGAGQCGLWDRHGTTGTPSDDERHNPVRGRLVSTHARRSPTWGAARITSCALVNVGRDIPTASATLSSALPDSVGVNFTPTPGLLFSYRSFRRLAFQRLEFSGDGCGLSRSPCLALRAGICYSVDVRDGPGDADTSRGPAKVNAHPGKADYSTSRAR